MKLSKLLYILALGYSLTNCQTSTKKDIQSRTIEQSRPQKETQVTPVLIPLDTLVAFANWTIVDSLLLIESSGTDNSFYLINLDNFHTIKSFGKKGNGPNEFIMPHLVRQASKITVWDNALHSLYQLSSETGVINQQIQLATNETFWQPSYFDSAHLCFVKNSPNELKWILYNPGTKETTDSIVFTDETQKGNAIQYEFTYSVNPTQLVIALNQQNEFSFYHIRQHLLHPLFTVKGETKKGQMYYTDVFTHAQQIYLLNQENINMETFEGESYIDIYTMEGECTQRLHVGRVVESMLLDEKHERILLFSPNNEDAIYSLPLSSI